MPSPSSSQVTSISSIVGHALASATGIAAITNGIAALMTDLPPVLGATLIVIGVVMPVLAYKSIRGSRAAWSFLISMLSVLAVVTFFGAPKIRKVLDTNLGLAFVIPALLLVSIVTVAKARDAYRPS
jgi:uncharacterized membrane protein HdeD (DUF308 family)